MPVKTATQLTAEIASLFGNNTVGSITPTALRTVTQDIVDSSVGQGVGAVVPVTGETTVSQVGNTYNVGLASTAVTPGTYGNATTIPQITFNAKGQATGVTPVPVSISGLTDANIAAGAAINATKLAFTDTSGAARPVASVLNDWSHSIDNYPGGNDDAKAAAAINARQGLPILFPGRTITLTGPLPALTSGTTIEGIPGQTTINRSGSGDLFTIQGSYCGIKHLTVSESTTSGNTIKLNAGTGGIRYITIEDIVTNASRGCIADTGSGAGGLVSSLFINRVQAINPLGHGFNFTRLLGFAYIDKSAVDWTAVAGSAASYQFSGFRGNGTGLPGNAGGVVLRDCSVLGTATQSNTNGTQKGYDFGALAEVRLWNCDAESIQGLGWDFQAVTIVRGSTIVGAHNKDHAININASAQIQLDNIRTMGRNPSTGLADSSPTTGSNGLRVTSSNLVQCTNLMIFSAYAEGIYSDSNSLAKFTSGLVANNGYSSSTGYGVKTVGTGAQRFVDFMFSNNGDTGNRNYSLAASFSSIDASQLNSGTYTGAVNSSGGAVTG